MGSTEEVDKKKDDYVIIDSTGIKVSVVMTRYYTWCAAILREI